MCRLLEHQGWSLRRIKGSHHIYSKPGERWIITVPVHGNQSLKPGLCRAILKMAGIEELKPCSSVNRKINQR
ncbi:MAG: type II toxin-antitoxin system HicA family toxin [Kiritimatiellae bacterium]|nr:type II toxin-antitoxin system HicA family toxin [Kiritimatiellia bacterium]